MSFFVRQKNADFVKKCVKMLDFAVFAEGLLLQHFRIFCIYSSEFVAKSVESL